MRLKHSEAPNPLRRMPRSTEAMDNLARLRDQLAGLGGRPGPMPGQWDSLDSKGSRDRAVAPGISSIRQVS